MELKDSVLAKCKYYKGEDDCPDGVPFIFWECEEMYVRHISEGDEVFCKSAVDFFCKLGLDKVSELNDGTPIEIQALMFERFCHNSDTDPEVLARSFPRYYLKMK